MQINLNTKKQTIFCNSKLISTAFCLDAMTSWIFSFFFWTSLHRSTFIWSSFPNISTCWSTNDFNVTIISSLSCMKLAIASIERWRQSTDCLIFLSISLWYKIIFVKKKNQNTKTSEKMEKTINLKKLITSIQDKCVLSNPSFTIPEKQQQKQWKKQVYFTT